MAQSSASLPTFQNSYFGGPTGTDLFAYIQQAGNKISVKKEKSGNVGNLSQLSGIGSSNSNGTNAGKLKMENVGNCASTATPVTASNAEKVTVSSMKREAYESPQLAEAPTFRPTEEEFEDPMKYMDSIKDEMHKYGVCKIVPPSDKWLQGKPFSKVVDTESFFFPTKIQNVHQLQNRNGPYTKFIEDLGKYLERKEVSLKNLPLIEGRELNLYKLYKVVTSKGGSTQVTHNKQWKDVAQELGYFDHSGVGVNLKQQYRKYLSAYEDFKKCKTEASESTPEMATGKESWSPKKKDDHEKEDEDNEFGYYDGKMYSLSQFKRMADTFKARWFAKEQDATPKAVENLYWSIVENSDESVRVHYGSDVEVSLYGSGFPNSPADLKKASSWNLNKFAMAPGSLLEFLGEPVAGVTIPMMYIGMLFSTFCWHTEDNFLYSINYLHHGAPKTWYGIPAYAADKFEQIIKDTVPELFDAKPDLLFLLITMLSPRILKEHNIPVYSCVQYPGEFMITVPRGYHAGFSHGFNCAESSNFALNDWMGFGRACVEEYRHFGRSSVLSLEKLMYNAARSENGGVKIPQLKGELLFARNKEIYLRDKVLVKEGSWKCVHFSNYQEDPGKLLECFVCKYDCFFSGVVCPCNPTNIACLRHSDRTCECPSSRKFLVYRCSIAEMDDVLKSLGCTDSDFVFDLSKSRRQIKSVSGRSGKRKDAPTSHTVTSSRKLARRGGLAHLPHVNYSSAPTSQNEGMIVVDSIVDTRTNNGKTECLVKWNGVSSLDTSWERVTDLACPVLLDAAKVKVNKAKRQSTPEKKRKMARARN